MVSSWIPRLGLAAENQLPILAAVAFMNHMGFQQLGVDANGVFVKRAWAWFVEIVLV